MFFFSLEVHGVDRDDAPHLVDVVGVLFGEELVDTNAAAHDAVTVNVHDELVLGGVRIEALDVAVDVPVGGSEPVLGLVPVGGPHHEGRHVLVLGHLALVDVDGIAGPAVHDAQVLRVVIVDSAPCPLLVVGLGEGLKGDLAAEAVAYKILNNKCVKNNKR